MLSGPDHPTKLTITAHAGPAEMDALCRTIPGLAGDPVRLASRSVGALRIAIAQGEEKRVRAFLSGKAGALKLDWAIGPARRSKLLLSDMDSTLIEQECLDELADIAGCSQEVAALTRRAMDGEIAFETAFVKRVHLLRGLPLSALDEVCRHRLSLSPGAKTLVGVMRASGAHCLLVSGGFDYFVSRLAAACRFHHWQANVAAHDGTCLTGETRMPLLGRRAKGEALRNEVARLGLSLSDALAIGDGDNDIEMIAHAGLGIAYKASPSVSPCADAHIRHTDLRSALFFQGYDEDDIALAESP